MNISLIWKTNGIAGTVKLRSWNQVVSQNSDEEADSLLLFATTEYLLVMKIPNSNFETLKKQLYGLGNLQFCTWVLRLIHQKNQHVDRSVAL